MRRQGNCRDKAPSGSCFNRLKNARVPCTRYATRTVAQANLFDHSEPFYNRKRLHSTLGYASPVISREHWISTQHEQQLTASCR